MKRLVWAMLAIFAFGFAAPAAQAADIPLLTWERGKEQNILLANSDIPKTWSIKLVGDSYPPLTFRMSSKSSDGSVVYSVQIPNDMPLGTYSAQVFDLEGQLSTIVAGVDLIDMRTFEVVSVPTSLKFLLLSIVFFIAAVTSMRSKKYSRLTYVHHRSLIEEGTLLYDNRFPSLLYKFYKLRAKSFESLQPTLFRFLLSRDSEFLHRLSPLAWTLFPGVGFVLGAITGFLTGQNMPNVPLIALFVLTVIGLVDALSGFYAAVGFIALQIISGYVINLTQLLALVAMSFAWVLIGLLADLFYVTSAKDFESDSKPNNLAPLGLASLLAGGLFMFSQSLANSFCTQIRENSASINLLGALVALAFFVRTKLRNKIDSSELKQVGEVTYTITRIFSGLFASIMWVLFLCACFSWSQSWSTSLISATVFAIPLFALVVRFSRPEIALIANWKRNIYLEATVVLVITFALFEFVAQLPYQVFQRSQIFMVIAFLPAIFHSLLSSLYDISETKRGEVAL